MSIPVAFQDALQLPVIAAPMFLVSGPDLVSACCKSGIIGSFPALNQRSSAGLQEWLQLIEKQCADYAQTSGKPVAPYAVNLIVHRSNPRLEADLKICVQHRVPLIITSLGANTEVVKQVHDYGGLVFHDVTTLRHAEKAAEADVDGLIAVCAGAGGHAGTLNPFAFLAELRRAFDKTLILAGCINHGHQIAAAQIMGADLAYMGTRFINTRQSLASEANKTMICQSHAQDIIYTPAISGVPGNFLKKSLEQAGLDAHSLTKKEIDFGAELDTGRSESKAWRDIWSAGQGVGTIDDVPDVEELVQRLDEEYRAALRKVGHQG